MWENLFSHIDIDPENVHIPPRRRAARRRRRRLRAATRTPIERAGGIDFQILGIGKTGHIGFNEPGSGAESRTRLVHARRGHAARRGGRFLRRGVRAARSDHDGRRHDSRGARDRDPRHRRAQGGDRPARGRRRDRRRGRGDVPPAPPEHDVLRRPRRRRGAHAHRDAVAARRGGVDAGADGARGHLAVADRRARRFSSSRSATTPSTHVVAGRAVRDRRAP